MGRRKAVANDAPNIGDNSGNLTADEKKKLAGFVSEIESHDHDRAVAAGCISDCYKAAKEAGFNTKALREIIRLKRMDRAKRDEFEGTVEAYMSALGMLSGTPLGDAAVARDLAPKGRVDVSNPPFNAADEEPRRAAEGDDLDIPQELRRA